MRGLAFLLLTLACLANADRNPTYDYIVVGAGNAGCPLTAKLIDAGHTVLLVEAGSLVVDAELQFERAAPRLAFNLWENSDSSYSFLSEQDANLGTRTTILHGKGFGGTTLINAGLYSRPNPLEYDAWGMSGWTGNDFVAEFLELENVNDNPIPNVQGTGGPLNVRFPVKPQSITDEFASLLSGVGFFEAQTSEAGFGGFGTFVRNKVINTPYGTRLDAFTAFLASKVGNPNLVLSGDTIATKILVEEFLGTKIAIGVELLSGGTKSWTAYANKEVIISAGVFESPKLLMLSGIGDATTLTSFDIPVVQDLPAVGQNLVARPLALLEYSGPTLLEDQDFLQSVNLSQIAAFQTGQGGFFTTPINAIYGFGTTNNEDIDYMYQITDTQPFFYVPDPTALGIACLVSNVQSRGSVNLRSTNPKDRPKVDPAFYSDSDHHDITAMVTCLSTFRSIVGATSPPFLTTEIIPGSSVSNAQLPETVLTTTRYSYHAFGSNAMGASPATSVVDTDLIVHGFANLRVVDGSVIPQPISCGPMTTIYAIGNKAGKMIVSDNYNIPIDFTRGHDIHDFGGLRLIKDPVAGTSVNDACKSVFSEPFPCNDPNLTCLSQQAQALLLSNGVSDAFTKQRGFTCDSLGQSSGLSQNVNCGDNLPVLCIK